MHGGALRAPPHQIMLNNSVQGKYFWMKLLDFSYFHVSNKKMPLNSKIVAAVAAAAAFAALI